MKKINLLSWKALLFFIIVVAAFLRFWQLGNIPYGITNDEAGYIYNSYSIFKTGKDITGKMLPLSTTLDSSISPIPSYIAAPFTGILGVSSFSGRLPFAILGVFSVILVFLIAKKLFSNENIALVSAFVLAISPWYLLISRSAYDGVIALFFYLFAFYLFLGGIEKKNTLWSLVPFFLAFYSYHATKVFFIVFIPALVFIYRDYFIKRKKEFFLFLGGFLAIILSFLIISSFQKVTRQEIFIWNNADLAGRTVDIERQKSRAPIYLKELFNNKPLYYLRQIRENYLEAFSMNYLFLYGDPQDVYSIHFRGAMYIIEFPLLLLGIAFLIKSNKKIAKIIIFSSIFLAPLPSAFTIDRNYAIRSIMMLPFLSIIVGCGIYYLFSSLLDKKTVIRKFFTLLIFVLYTFLLSSYLYQYYFRYTVYGPESWFRSSRELTNFINDNKSSNKIYLYDPGKMYLLQYAVFNKINPDTIQKIWQKPLPWNINKLIIVGQCPKDIGLLAKNTMQIVRESCLKKSLPTAVIRDFGEHGRVIWKIYEK